MPMDRLTRTLAGLGLALIAAAGGCRSAHDEVPPGKAYRPDMGNGQVGFSTTPPAKGLVGAPQNLTQGNMANGGIYGNQLNGGMYGGQPGNGSYGGYSSQTGGDMTGTVAGRGFGAPGSAGSAGTMDGATQPAAGGGLSGLGQAPPLMGNPNATRDDASYLNGFPNQPPAAGTMGTRGQPPSPL
jgi:hypothetical protein